jgi:lipopolysaccharide export system permease protein
MKIIYIYIAKKFTKTFLLTVSTVALVGIIATLFEKMNFYIEHGASFKYIILHIFARLPWWLAQALPVATLLALLFSLSDLSKKNEISAAKAAGINIWKIIFLFIFMGLGIGLSELAAKEFLIPETERYYQTIKQEKIQKEKIWKQTAFHNLVVALSDNKRLTIGHLDTEKNLMKSIAIENYSDDFFIEKLILAETAVWKNNRWVLKNAVSRDFSLDSWKEKHHEEYDPEIEISPESISVQDIRYEGMNTKEFIKQINRFKLFGQSLKAKFTEIALNMRYAGVFSHTIVMIVGIPFVIGFRDKFNKILSFTLALFAAFIYWGTQMISRSCGESLILSPFWAAWLPNFIFLTAGSYLLCKVKK